MGDKRLNAGYSSLAMKQRYEVWFLRCGLADGSGAWWFRYLTMNLGRGKKPVAGSAMPAQVWATWFPRDGEPQSFIQGFSLEKLSLSEPSALPFHCHIAENGIAEEKCWGNLNVNGHAVGWNLQWDSHFGFVLSNKGWIGFSKSPHSDAVFSGEICFDGKTFAGEPLGFGVQGHNCGHRHRTYWRWMHAYFPNAGGQATTLEALVYDLPFGWTFRKVVLWHEGCASIMKSVEERQIVKKADSLNWEFSAIGPDGRQIQASIAGTAPSIHRLLYARTDGLGTFPVVNASLAHATLTISKKGAPSQTLRTDGGAVLEMGGS